MRTLTKCSFCHEMTSPVFTMINQFHDVHAKNVHDERLNFLHNDAKSDFMDKMIS